MCRKIIGLLLVVTMTCSMIVGCGSALGITDSKLESLFDERNAQRKQMEVAVNDYYYHVDYSSSGAEIVDDSLTCYGSVYQEYNEYMTLGGKAVAKWSYDPRKLDWVCDEEEIDLYATLNVNVEGRWGIYNRTDGIYIRNQTLGGMDVFVEGFDSFGDNWVRVQLDRISGENVTAVDLNDGKCTVVYTGKNTDGKYITVVFNTELDGGFWVTVYASTDYAGRSDSRWAYYENYRAE